MTLSPSGICYRIDYRQQSSASVRFSLSRVMPLLSSGGNLESLSIIDSIGPQLALPLENLGEAILSNCEFSSSELRNVIQNCKRLRKFVYVVSDPDDNVSRSARATPREVVEALAPACTSLEALGLDFRNRPRADGRIRSLEQFASLKTLYIDITCVWDPRAALDNDSPPTQNILFTTLLPESIEQMAFFGMDCDAEAFGFDLEAHVNRLASERQEKDRFKQLQRFHGQGFWPFGYDLTPRLVENDDLGLRITALNDAKAVLGDNGVEVMFDGEKGLKVWFEKITYFY